MREGTPSRTAWRVALRRAAHQVFDQPIIFDDPLALRILGLTNSSNWDAEGLRAPNRPHSVSLRAFLVARSRFAEDTLTAAVYEGVRQYVLLGAGLDTFAYRNPFPQLQVFEVDHPDTQAWKLHQLEDHDIDVPQQAHHVAVDFHHDDLAERLRSTGFDPSQPAVFAWLGVVPYLTDEGFTATLNFLSSCAPGSVLIFDYGMPRHALPPLERLALDSMSARVAAAGEPFRLFFMPDEIHHRLHQSGWQLLHDLDRNAINTRYFSGSDLHVLSSGGHLLAARLQPQR